MNKLLYLLAFLAAGLPINAQQGLTNFGNLHVHSGALSVVGHFNNTSQGILLNRGQLTVKGNVQNNQPGMAAGTGVLQLDGTNAQEISGSQTWRTHHLITQNNAGISLVSNMEVAGQHQFLAGTIQTVGAAYLEYGSGATHTGSTNSRHVAGWVRKSGSAGFTFPVGNGTMHRPVQVSSMQGAGTYEVRYGQNTPYANQVHNGLVAVTPSEYWEVQTVAGGAAALTLSWDGAQVAMPAWGLAEIRVAQLGGTTWNDAGGSASGNVEAQGSITAPIMQLSGMYTFGQKSVPLPLTLVSFTARRSNDISFLTWQTVAEQGVERFVVERSDDGLYFTPIGSVAARNRGSEERYQWQDARAIGRMAYYRLQCIDLDGKIKKSQVVTVTQAVSKSLALLTNPVQQTALIKVPQDLGGQYQYAVTNTGGLVVQQGTITLPGGGIVALSLERQLVPGVYFLKLYSKHQTQVLRLVRE